MGRRPLLWPRYAKGTMAPVSSDWRAAFDILTASRAPSVLERAGAQFSRTQSAK
jgi:hypothetical protein